MQTSFSALLNKGVGLLALVCVASSVATFATNAGAHAILVTPKAEAGSFYKAAIGITHGCAGTPTREVTVLIPAGVTGAKPMPKPGWTIDIERSKLTTPRESHGRQVLEEVTKIRWSGGSLPNAYYDEFSLVATLPAQAGPLYWQVSQACDQGRYDWVEIPAPGQDARELKSPALRLELTPAMHMGHQH